MNAMTMSALTYYYSLKDMLELTDAEKERMSSYYNKKYKRLEKLEKYRDFIHRKYINF